MPRPTKAAPSTAWAPARANQQLVSQLRRSDAAHAERCRAHAQATALGQRLSAAWTGAALPLIAVQTHFSLLEGTAAPAAWAIALSAWHGAALPAPVDRRGGNHPGGATAVAMAGALAATAQAQATSARARTATSAPAADTGVWAALADRNDLTGLPATLSQWGRGRTAVGATIACHGHEVVLLAPSARAYAALCTVLTRRYADERALPAMTDVIALVRDAGTGQWLAAAGADVRWRAELRPVTEATPFPAVAVPLLAHLDDDRAAAPVLSAIRARGTVAETSPSAPALADLVAMRATYRGYEDQLAASAALRLRAWALPPPGSVVLQLPPLPPALEGVVDADVELRRLAEAGIAARYGAETPAVRARLEHELTVIAGKHFASYLLTVHAIVRGRRTCGRGSAASSVVVYLLGITNVDPVRWNLLFDRFLSPERTDPPDVDIDFPWDERDAVFSWILSTFGAARVGMVATHQHLSFDGALREAARAHGLPDAAITAASDRLHDLDRYGVDRDGGRTLDVPGPWARVLATAALLKGSPRHLGVHCGGVVITRGPLSDLVPVHPAAKMIPDPDHPGQQRPMPTIAWEKDGAEDLGLVKIDVLGNRSLAVIRDSLADLRAQGVDVERTWQPLNDARTGVLLAQGDTVGCFYVESPAMRQLQAKVGDGSFERLVVHSSIIRPAGMAFISTYIARHHHVHTLKLPPEPAWYPHPALKELLSESYGVLSYQEDVMLAARALAGFSPGEANRLRKALGRSDTAERLAEQVGAFVAGCRANHIADDVINLVWRMISSFAGYSFAKAHSASYAMVSMQCAWLKAHYPAVFLARVIANEGGFYRRSAYVEEARRLGIVILPPCVQSGAWATCGVSGTDGAGRMRLGFHCVAGISRATAAAITQGQPFAGVRDLVARTGCAADEAQALLEAGAFDVLLATLTIAQRAWTVASARSSRPARTRPGQQCIDLDDDARDPLPPTLPAAADAAVDAQNWARRRLQRLGALPEAHPLSLWRFRCRPARRARDLPCMEEGDQVTFIAHAITRKDVNAVYEEAEGTMRTADMAFVTFEDETGLIETTWFPETYRRYAVLLERGEPLMLTGTVEKSFGVTSLAVRSAHLAVG